MNFMKVMEPIQESNFWNEIRTIMHNDMLHNSDKNRKKSRMDTETHGVGVLFKMG